MKFNYKIVRLMSRGWPVYIGVCLALAASWSVALGATFNVNFNNTEQGNNSTATPMVRVEDGRTVSNGANASSTGQNGAHGESPLAEPSANPLTSALSTPPSPAQSVAEEKASKSADETGYGGRHVRFGVGANYLRKPGGAIERGAGPIVSIAFPWNRYFGVGFFIGVAGSSGFGLNNESKVFPIGGEIEITPLHISLFKSEDLISVGVNLGVNKMTDAHGDLPVPMHAGARLEVNFSSGFGANVSGRTDFAGMAHAETGVFFRL